MGLGTAVIWNILNVPRLARRLAADEIQNWHAATYLVAGNVLYIVFAFIAGHLLDISGARYTEVAFAEASVAAVIVVIGTRNCFNAYRGDDFIKAFIVLSVPALIYSTILTWLIHKGVYYAIKKYGETTSFATADAAETSMAFASRLLEGGAIAAAVIGLVSFYLIIRMGLKLAANESK